MGIPNKLSPMTGGGDTLPRGYLAAEFMFINTQLYNVPIFTVSPDTPEAKLEVVLNVPADVPSAAIFVTSDSKQFGIALYAPWDKHLRWQYGGSFEYGGAIEFDKKYKLKKVGRFNYVDGELVYTNVKTSITATQIVSLASAKIPWFYLYSLKCDNTKDEKHEYIPALTPEGSPCLYDKVTNKPYILNLTVGLTLSQARKLSKLPVTETGALTVSLPWEAQLVITGVPAALQVAADRGWTITVQYRDPEADNIYYNRYANCVTVADMQAVNAGYKYDLTSDGKWIYPLLKLKNGPKAFQYAFSLKKICVDLPSLTSAGFMFDNARALTYFDASMPNLKGADVMFGSCVSLESFEGDLSFIVSGDSVFRGCKNMRVFKSSLSGLKDSIYMFESTQLDKESALNVLNSLQTFTDGGQHRLMVGIHTDLQTDDEVIAAIENAEAKGWTLTVQWNGTATAQTASTFGLRKPPIYAKLGTAERPDDTTENVLDWGHYVTNWEARGYMEFASVEEAEAHFNINQTEEL